MKHPLKLVIVADDLTGAFDTGVQFQKRGACVVFTTLEHLTMCSTDDDVVVIDTESRHDQPAKAYEKTASAVRWAREQGAVYVYIKTDSGLRGNMGPSLKAAVETLGCVAAFVPAYPEMNRITVKGRHSIDGVPVHQSVFGRDPFDPVTTDVIKELLAPSGVRAVEMAACDLAENGTEQKVWIFDAATDADLAQIAAGLARRGQLRLTAGCAAFAAALYGHLGLPLCPVKTVCCREPLLVVCGSVNAVSRRQILYGEAQGCFRQTIEPQLLCEDDFWFGADGAAWRERLWRKVQTGKSVLIDTGFDIQRDAVEKRTVIASRLGGLMQGLLQRLPQGGVTPMVIGGDTLMGFLASLEKPDVRLEGSLDGGVVVFSVLMGGTRRRMLSKSGGFGSETLLKDIAESEKR